MKVIVGLGNPGPRYKDTRHNVGFQTLEELARRHPVQRQESRFDAIIAHLQIKQEKVFLLKPLTYMNLSGKAVRALIAYYKIDLKDIIVIYDDMDLPVGNLRIRSAGGTGGHRGMTSLVENLGTREFARIRIGIGRPPHEAIDWVLGRFSPEEKPLISNAVARAADAVETWIANGIEKAMNEYN
ncbi:MAG: aminoacyl-tRNA hydrolase [Syntrophomonadaceae bacterium]|jgi:PTH1 family peptidyl-tRNA hydrolase|nr:aminoacyl-tRNA hydrolase [Bacillota bacterium]